MIQVQPETLERGGIRLEPLTADHAQGLSAAVADGHLWELWFVAVPEVETMPAYIETALKGQRDGTMLPWAVRDLETGSIIGCTRYHDIVPTIDRVEIGYTWYAQSRQRSHVNTTCKLLLLEYAFDRLGCKVVGLRTDGFNFRSQRRSKRWEPRKMGCSGTMGLGATALRGTSSCTASSPRSGRTCGATWSFGFTGIELRSDTISPGRARRTGTRTQRRSIPPRFARLSAPPRSCK